MEIKCEWCEKIFNQSFFMYKRNKHNFCSKKCCVNWCTKHFIGKNNPNYKGKIKIKCDNCKKEVQINYYELKTYKHHFCKNNYKCYYEWRSKFLVGKNNPNYIDGRSFLPYPEEFNASLKEKIRKRDNYKCQNKDCGIPQKECLCALDIHHIDYDKNNSDPINLISLCKIDNTKANKNRKYWQNYYEQIQIDRKVHLLDMQLEMEGNIE